MLEIKILNPLVGRVSYAPATVESAGIDLYAAIDHPLAIRPGESAVLGTGVAVQYISNSLVVGILALRSGFATKNGVVMINSIGIIDQDYQGELKAALYNLSKQEVVIRPLERFAQIVFIPRLYAYQTVVGDFSRTTSRNEKGFGSSGEF